MRSAKSLPRVFNTHARINNTRKSRPKLAAGRKLRAGQKGAVVGGEGRGKVLVKLGCDKKKGEGGGEIFWGSEKRGQDLGGYYVPRVRD